MYEFIKDNTTTGQIGNNAVNIITISFIASQGQTQFSVGDNIGTLFSVSVNGLSQIQDLHFTHVNYTTKITFLNLLPPNAVITIQYYKGINSVILDNTGKLIQFTKEEFIYTGSLVFDVKQSINSLFGVETNGLAEKEYEGYDITNDKEITYNYSPLIGSKISISYFY